MCKNKFFYLVVAYIIFSFCMGVYAFAIDSKRTLDQNNEKTINRFPVDFYVDYFDKDYGFFKLFIKPPVNTPQPSKILQPSKMFQPKKYSVIDNEMKGKKIPILMYHEVADENWGIESLFVRPSDFEQQLQYLQKNGYQTITFEDFDHISDFKKPIMLTFDDGYIGNYTYMYPLLKKYNMKATIFMITDAVYSKKHINIPHIKEMSDSGLVSIQSHTKTHYAMENAKVDKTLKEEFVTPKTRLEEITGKKPFVFAYAYGKWNENILPEVKKEYKYALLNNGGVFKCGDNLMLMKRIGISRSTSLEDFKNIVQY